MEEKKLQSTMSRKAVVGIFGLQAIVQATDFKTQVVIASLSAIAIIIQGILDWNNKAVKKEE